MEKKVNFGLDLSENYQEAEKKLVNNLQEWLSQRYKRHQLQRWHGIHDEGTFVTAWREYYLLTQDPIVFQLAETLLKKSSRWITKHWPFGYAPRQEVHHGVEHFIIFLAWLYELIPENAQLKHQLIEASQNIYQTARPETQWYDFETNRFRSTHLGSKVVGKEAINIVEHLRLIRLAWLGFAAGGEEQLRDIIMAYCNEWIHEFKKHSEVPVFLDGNAETMSKFHQALNTFIGAAPKEITLQTRSELHIANGTPELFLKLFQLTNNHDYLEMVKKILLPILDQLSSPYAHPIGDLAWQYYQIDPIPDIRDRAMQIYESLQHRIDAGEFQRISANLHQTSWKTHKYYLTVGIRKDMPEIELYPTIREETTPIPDIPSPSTFGLIYRLTGDETMMQMGMEFANAAFSLARASYPDGRKHGCNSKAIHSFVVGHGRNWGAGYVSTILRTALGKEIKNINLPKIEI